MPSVLAVVAAQGTRGDVQPVALAAWQLAKHLEQSLSTSTAIKATLITHAAHRSWLNQLELAFHDGADGRQLELKYLTSPPASIWHGAQSRHKDSGTPDTLQHANTRAELLQHCCTALQLPLPASTATSSSAHSTQHTTPQSYPSCMEQLQRHSHQQQHTASQQQQQLQPQRLLLFNLFALEAYSIAEALQVPCCVLQPYLIPYSMPAGFQHRFERAAPHLAAQLQAATAATAHAARDLSTNADLVDGCSAAAAAVVSTLDPEATMDGSVSSHELHPVSWKDVSHWMWPLFTERWGSWRQERLGIEPWPLQQAVQQQWQGCTFAAATATTTSGTGLLDAASIRATASASVAAATTAAAVATSVGAAEGKPHRQIQQESWQMPMAVPVLYGLSPAIVTQPGFWPMSVNLCGFWLTADLHRKQHQQGQRETQQQQQQQQHNAQGQSREVGQQASSYQQCQLPPALNAFLLQGCNVFLQPQQQVVLQPQQQVASIDFQAGAVQHLGPTMVQQQQQLEQQQQHQHMLVVDFGSMGALGLLRDAQVLLQVLLGALLLLGPQWKIVLLTGGWQPLVEAHQTLLSCCNTESNSRVRQQTGEAAVEPGVAAARPQLAEQLLLHVQPTAHPGTPESQLASTHQEQQQPQQQQRQQQLSSVLPNLFVQHEAVACHHLLLEGAAVLLHHGGSGTTAAALAAGVPQLVCPLQFDQFYWAERVADLGCAPAPLSAQLLVPDKASDHPTQPASRALTAGAETSVPGSDTTAQPVMQQEQVADAAATVAQGDAVWSVPSVRAAAAYLATHVEAARQPSVLQACRKVQHDVAREQGLDTVVTLVQGYLDSLCS